MRVLLIRLSALGDVILTEPVIRALRTLGATTIDLVTDVRFASLMARATDVDRVVGYDFRVQARGLRGVASVAREIGDVPYDWILDLQNKVRTRLLARRVPARHRMVLRKRSLSRAIASLLGSDPPIDDRHASQIYLDAMASAGLPVAALATSASPAFRPRLRRPETTGLYVSREVDAVRAAGETSEASEAGKAHGVSGQRLRIGLCPSATHPTKMWGAPAFGMLASALVAAPDLPPISFLAIGGPSDRTTLDTMRAHATGAVFEVLDVARLDVEGLASVLASLDLLVSVDSGPAHLAAAMDVPTVVLFGPTSFVRWGPLGAPHQVVSLALDCAPCSNTGGARCPRPDRNHACMRDLHPARVLDAIRAALSGERR
ncbi:MAG: glycosyltransferase family 9 protein [Deltaproteobacteria bacterium]|nr:glycosyltransferase family 9 protein [Deltaproteobacteria bacterium]